MTSKVLFKRAHKARADAVVTAAASIALAALCFTAIPTEAQASKTGARAKSCATWDHVGCAKPRQVRSRPSAANTERITRHIARYLEYPRQSQFRRETGKSYTSFMVSPAGEVSNIKTEQSSGFSELDRAARRAVMFASPIPADLTGSLTRHCKFIVPISFQM